MSQDLSNATLFEVSWEVCNKVGGIYAVVSSKILEALATFGENYFLLGPDLGNNPDFEETDEPCWQELRQETDRRNLSCRFGRWSIPGRYLVFGNKADLARLKAMELCELDAFYLDCEDDGK